MSRAAWPWFIPLTLRFSAETLSANEQLLGAYLKLAMTILLPAQLLLFPACAPPPSTFRLCLRFGLLGLVVGVVLCSVWALAQLHVVPEWAIDALHTEENWALWYAPTLP